MRISMELESSEMIKQFVMAELGIGFMAVTNAQAELGRGAAGLGPAGAPADDSHTRLDLPEG